MNIGLGGSLFYTYLSFNHIMEHSMKFFFVLALLLNMFLISGCKSGDEANIVEPLPTDEDSNIIETLPTDHWKVTAAVSNGAFDNARSMANSVYDPASNTTFSVYMGGMDESTAGIYAFSWNHTTKVKQDPIAIYIFSENDTRHDGHSYPQIVRSLDGYIHIFFVNQRSIAGADPHTNFHIRFSQPGTISENFTINGLRLGGEGLLGRNGSALIRAEYPKTIVARDGTMFYFTRAVPYGSQEPEFTYDGETYRVAYRPQIYIKSTDHGLTWQPAKIAIERFNLQDFLMEPYLTQIISEPERPGVAERFHFTWTLAAGFHLYYDQNGDLIDNYHNGYSKNIYHAYFVPSEDTFYSIDGTNLGANIDGDEMDLHCLAVVTGEDTVPDLPMSYEEHQTVSLAPSRTSIMGNTSSIDDQGGIIINGRWQWSGSAWLDRGKWPSDILFSEWRDGFYFAYQKSGSVYTSVTGLEPWTVVGNIFDDKEGTQDIPDSILSSTGSARITATPQPAHPEARFWYKKYGTETFQGFVALCGQEP